MTIKAKPPYMTTVLSRKESNPYTLTNGIVRARTQTISATSTRLGRVASEATNAPVRRKTTVPMRKRDLAHIERWEAEIGEAFPHQRIAQQCDREEREITIALQKRATRFCFERVSHCSFRVGRRCNRLIVSRGHRGPYRSEPG